MRQRFPSATVQPKAVRHAFTERFRSKVEMLLVGALTLSRAVDDPQLADDILAAAARTFGRP